MDGFNAAQSTATPTSHNGRSQQRPNPHQAHEHEHAHAESHDAREGYGYGNGDDRDPRRRKPQANGRTGYHPGYAEDPLFDLAPAMTAAHALSPTLTTRIHPAFAAAPAPARKMVGDYLRALKRRAGIVVVMMLLITIPGSIWVLRKPARYETEAQVMITPPSDDDRLRSLITQEVSVNDSKVAEKYMPNSLALLKSKYLAERVAADPQISAAVAGTGGDPTEELLTNLEVKTHLNSNYITLKLTGADPAWITRLLNSHINQFREYADRQQSDHIETTKTSAAQNIRKLEEVVKGLEEKVNAAAEETNSTDATGGSILRRRLEQSMALYEQEKQRYEFAEQKAQLSELFPDLNANGENMRPAKQTDVYLRDLKRTEKALQIRLNALRKQIRNFEYDPQVKLFARQLKQVMDEIDEITSMEDTEVAVNLAPTQAAILRESVIKKDRDLTALIKKVKEEQPAQQKYLNLLKEYDAKRETLHKMQAKLTDFDFMATKQAQSNPVEIMIPAKEPRLPIGPNRPLYLCIFAFLGVAAGVGVVCLMEHSDHSVKAPEQLTTGLSVPLFGIIPRIVRTAAIDRGGHLWIAAAPQSAAADAYRNLRASLVGACDQHGSLISLLITSAKSGEGKSTTAINLAASCARAGERTILLDVDLRRPTLARAFPVGQDQPGLIDILRGETAWQNVVHRTELPNLDYLPTGDVHDVPTEILGTLELRQLIQSLRQNYDRVILDGPAVLGMADCRMLGRIVDAALFVVRAGTQTLQPLLRAKAMLEQSRVTIPGIVLNAMYEDMKNWCNLQSYTPPALGGSGLLDDDDDHYPNDFADEPNHNSDGESENEGDRAESVTRVETVTAEVSHPPLDESHPHHQLFPNADRSPWRKPASKDQAPDIEIELEGESSGATPAAAERTRLLDRKSIPPAAAYSPVGS